VRRWRSKLRPCSELRPLTVLHSSPRFRPDSSPLRPELSLSSSQSECLHTPDPNLLSDVCYFVFSMRSSRVLNLMLGGYREQNLPGQHRQMMPHTRSVTLPPDDRKPGACCWEKKPVWVGGYSHYCFSILMIAAGFLPIAGP